MNINNVTSSTSVPNESKTSDASFQAAGDFDTFLKLLTAQMRNQDPLQPMDSTDFVAQLASFSAVEQQIQTNEKLDRLISLFSTSADSGLAEWIGKDIRSSKPIEFNGSPIEVEFYVDPTTTSSKLVVENSAGNIVYEQEVNSSDQRIVWRGETLDPNITAPAGDYSFAIISTGQEGVTKRTVADTVSQITEIREANGEMVFVLENGNTVSFSDLLS